MTTPSFVVSDVSCGNVDHLPSEDCSYRVAWSINPHMKIGAVDADEAKAQHAAFVRLLVQLGAETTTLPFVHGAHDSVFAKDNAVIVDDRALLARPRFPERLAEQAIRARALESIGIEVTSSPRSTLEGGDVVMQANAGRGFLGYGFRSEREAAADLEKFIGGEVVPLRLVDPRLYHLDMAFAVLADGTAIVCEEALDLPSSTLVRKLFHDVVCVSVEDALTFGVNLVQIGRSVVLGGRSPAVMRALASRGYDVHVPRLDQFHLAGGSAACLVAARHASSVRTRIHAA